MARTKEQIERRKANRRIKDYREICIDAAMRIIPNADIWIAETKQLPLSKNTTIYHTAQRYIDLCVALKALPIARRMINTQLLYSVFRAESTLFHLRCPLCQKQLPLERFHKSRLGNLDTVVLHRTQEIVTWACTINCRNEAYYRHVYGLRWLQGRKLRKCIACSYEFLGHHTARYCCDDCRRNHHGQVQFVRDLHVLETQLVTRLLKGESDDGDPSRH